ncbi:hypothetical protein HC176_17685, partial [Tamlana crocina]|nr:hypothetical protein [Tamlana crocina]
VEHKVLENNSSEPEVLQPLASEEKVKEKKSSAERGVKKDIFETPSRNAAEEQGQLAFRTPSEEPEADEPKENSLLAESSSPVSESFRTAEVSDTEVEALLLLASAELQADSVYTVNSRDL